MSTIFLRVDYLDQDYDRAHEFPNRQTFGDFADEGRHRGSEYIWAKTTEEEAARIIGSRWKQYVDRPDSYERSYFD